MKKKLLIPVRCFTCGLPIGQYYDSWLNRKKAGDDPKEILDSFGLERYCCRRMLFTHVEILDETIKFSLTATKLRINREF